MSHALGFFGKLPHFGDFIRSREESGCHAAFREWLGSSWTYTIPLVGERPRDAYLGLPVVNGVTRIDEVDSTVIFLCRSSHDEAVRWFPFSIFAELPDKQTQSNLRVVPFTYALFTQIGLRHFERAEQSFSDDATARESTLWSLREGLKADLTESTLRLRAQMTRLTFEEMLASLGISVDAFKVVLWGLVAARQAYSAQFHAVLRFPLSGDSAKQSLEISFWATLAEKVLQTGLSGCSLFWTDRHFDIVFGATTHRTLSLSWLPVDWLPNRDADLIWDFRSMVLEPPVIDGAKLARLQEVLSVKGSTLHELLIAVEAHLAAEGVANG